MLIVRCILLLLSADCHGDILNVLFYLKNIFLKNIKAEVLLLKLENFSICKSVKKIKFSKHLLLDKHIVPE